MRKTSSNYSDLSSAQLSLWLQNQSHSSDAFNHLNFAAKLLDKDYINDIKVALSKIFSRYDSLRTSYWQEDGQVKQCVVQCTDFHVEDVWLETADMDIVSEAIQSESTQPYCLQSGKLMRAKFFYLSDGEVIFYLGFHHIAVDLWSMTTFANDLGQLLSGSEGFEVDQVSVNNYFEFARYQSEMLASAKGDKLKKFWEAEVAQVDTTILLPDYVRGDARSSRTSSEKIIISGKEFLALKDFAKTMGKSMYELTLTGFLILLSKITSKSNVSVVTPFSGRSERKFRNTFGFFVNTILNRHDIQPDRSIAELIQEVSKRSKTFIKNQEYPFAFIKNCASFEGVSLDSAHDQIEFAFDRPRKYRAMAPFIIGFGGHTLKLGKVALESLELKVSPIKRDIQLFLSEGEDKLFLSLNFKNELFSNLTIKKLVSCYLNVLNLIVKNPNTLISELDYISFEEKELLLDQLNSAPSELSFSRSIVEEFEDQVRRTPDRAALHFDGESMTYTELNLEVNKVAHFLRKQGVTEGTVVGLMVSRSFEMLIGLYGIVKAGATYFPIDVDYPKDRVRYLLDDSRTSVVLYCDDMDHDNLMEGLHFYSIEDILAQEKLETFNLDLNLSPSRSLYLMYTSGSTGKPKGVKVTEHSFQNLLKWYSEDHYEVTDKDNVLLMAPISFDLAQKNLFVSLAKGGSLYILEPGLFDYRSILRTIKEYEITLINCTPSAFKPLIDLDPEYSSLAPLRAVYLGGEPLQPQFLSGWYNSKSCQAKIINSYGPAECTDVSTSYHLEQRDFESNSATTIGKPNPNVQVYVLDPSQQLLPAGFVGEICIGGQGVALGYLNRPELTNERFTILRLSDSDSRPIYRTGDIGRWNFEGTLDFLGRSDHQVKIRGYRIEIDEIEVQLSKHSLIKDAVVISYGELNNQYLVAYVLEEADVSSADLRDYLTDFLPDYMIPAYFVPMKEFPLTPNGKIDRNAFPIPLLDGISTTEYIEPSNDTEVVLIELFQSVLGVKKIGVLHDFFELGGHSLKAIQLSTRIFKEFHVDVSLKDIFGNSNVKSIASVISHTKKSKYFNINPVTEKRDSYPASSSQKRLFVLNQIEDSSTSYNMPAVFLLKGQINIKQIEKSFSKLLERHEVLRTSFSFENGKVIQKIKDSVDFKIEVGKLDKSIDSSIADFVRSFDLEKAPLIRVMLLSKSSNENYLLIDMHHIVSDGVSTGLIIRDFIKIYHGQPLTPLRLQYKDFSVWQEEWLLSSKAVEDQEFWIENLSDGIAPLELPTDYPRVNNRTFKGKQLSFQLDEDLSRKIHRFCKSEDVTLYMFFLASLNIVLHKYTGQEDIAIGSPVTGRSHEDIQEIVGMFVNTLVMRNMVDRSSEFGGFLDKLRSNTLSALEHQAYPFEKLIEEINVPRDESRNPLFDVFLVLQNTNHEELYMSDMEVVKHPVEINTSKFDLSFIVEPKSNDDLNVIIEYRTDLYRDDTIGRLYGHLVNVMKQVTIDPTVSVHEIELVNGSEKEGLINHFSKGETKEFPISTSVAELISCSVDKYSENIAVTDGVSCLSYRELNDRATSLAHKLIEESVKPGDIVGIAMDKSINSIIATFSIWKCGASILNLNAALPKERLKYIIGDSGAKVLLIEDSKTLSLENKNSLVVIDILKHDFELNTQKAFAFSNPGPDNCYTIYTSGSTGRPKGVSVSNSSTINFIYSMFHAFGEDYSSEDRCLSLTPISFDVYIFELLMPLVFGGTLVLYKNPDLYYKQIADFIHEQKITSAYIPPSILNQVCTNLTSKFQGCKLDKLLVGVEPIQYETLNAYKRLNPKIKIVNGYGPTECTVVASYYSYDDTIHSDKPVPIGKALPNTSIFILKDDQLAPIGIEGELCISGAGLANGYINNDVLNIQKFTINPISQERMYRTGDICRWRYDGNIEFVGRRDFQVKIRGHRIELGEIRSLIVKLEKVEDALVISSGESENQYLVAYIVSNQNIESVEIEGFLRQYLPDYMIPKKIISLDTFPLNANGKIDRLLLPNPINDLNEAAQEILPCGELEELIIGIFKKVLGVKKVGVNHDFFELGGHSLKAMDLVYEIEVKLNVTLSLKDIFENGNPRSLAYVVENKIEKSEKPKINYPVSKTVNKNNRYPLSFAQQRMWFIDQMQGGSANYNVVGAFKAKGIYETDRIRSIFNVIVDRHEILRTSFHSDEGVPYQKIRSSNEFYFSKTIAKSYTQVQAIIDGEMGYRFDLEKDSLLRINLLSLNDESYLIVNMHHIVSDGWSMGILVGEFASLWNNNGPLTFDSDVRHNDSIQYRDYSVWQKSQPVLDTYHSRVEYWLRHLDGHPCYLDFSNSGSRQEILLNNSRGIKVEIQTDILESIKELARNNGCSLFMVIIASYYIALYRIYDEHDLVIGTVSANRYQKEIRELLGFFANTLGLRFNQIKDVTVSQLLEYVKEIVLNGFENDDIPFDYILERLNPPRIGNSHPLFQAAFILQTNDLDLSSISNLQISEVELEDKDAKFDLFLNLREVNGILIGHLNFNTCVINESVAQSVANYISNLLAVWICDDKMFLSESYERVGSRLGASHDVSDAELEDILSELDI